MRLLVLGGTGFVGRAVAEEAARRPGDGVLGWSWAAGRGRPDPRAFRGGRPVAVVAEPSRSGRPDARPGPARLGGAVHRRAGSGGVPAGCRAGETVRAVQPGQ